MNNAPSSDELTKLINLCYNAVGNSILGPVKRIALRGDYSHQALNEDQIKQLTLEGKGDMLETIVDAASFNVMQILLGQLCPKSPQQWSNKDGDNWK